MGFFWNWDVVMVDDGKAISNGTHFSTSIILLSASISNPEHTVLITHVSQ